MSTELSISVEPAKKRVRPVWLYGWLSGLGILATLAAWYGLSNVPQSPAIPAVATSKEIEIARRSFESQYGRAADRDDILSWLAEWFQARHRPADAVRCFAEISTDHAQYGRMARYQQGCNLLELHRAVEAEAQFSELITREEQEPSISPKFVIDARQRLRHIMEVELRFEDRQALLKGVIERKEADSFETIAACFPSQLRWNGVQAIQWIEEFYAAEPTERAIRVAMGRYLTGQGKLPEARTLLEEVVREFPDDLRATSALIACLKEADAAEEADRLIAALPPISEHDSWPLLLQRGAYALQNGQPQAALEIYERVLRLDRSSGEAWQGVANAARLLGNASRRAEASKIAAGLGRLQNHIGRAVRTVTDPEAYIEIAEVCAEIEFNPEGRLVIELALKLAPKNERAIALEKVFLSRLPALSPSGPQEKSP